MGKFAFIRKKSHHDDVQHWDSHLEKLWNSILGDIQSAARKEHKLCPLRLWGLMKPQPKPTLVQPLTEGSDNLNDVLSSHGN